MKKIILFLMLTAMIQYSSSQNEFEPNYDESKVPIFDLSDPLVTFSGEKISTISKWENDRRPELLNYFTQYIYGKVPGELERISYRLLEESDNALNGKAKRKQIKLTFLKNGKELSYNLLLYLPNHVEKAPIFLGYNFYGNHTIADDSNILISKSWTRNNESLGIKNNQLTKELRGVSSDRWAIEKMIDSGFGFATIYYGDIDPDKNDMTDGIQSLFYKDNLVGPESNEWGSIAAWSWGLSRAMDWFVKDDDIDASKVIVFGHSRLGKAALWAGASDQRFAAVISNNSGCGGAALSKRKFGETVSSINNSFPHWFSDNFKRYNDNEEQLPIDQHELLALIAPRPLYVASAEADLWADPRGEFLSTHFATPVYQLYNKIGISSPEMPNVNNPIKNTLAYHIRTGKHDITDYDWDQYIKWAKEQLF